MVKTTETAPRPAEPPVLIGANGEPIDNYHSLDWCEKAEAFARGKQHYEGLYPQTGHGGKRTAGMKRGGPVAFVDYAAKHLKKNRDTISRYARYGAALIELRETLKDHPVVNDSEQMKLLSKQPRETRKAVVKKLFCGQVRTVKDALAQNNRQRANHPQVQSYVSSCSNGNGRPMPFREWIDRTIDEVHKVQLQPNVANSVAQHLNDAVESLQEALQAQEAEEMSRLRQREDRLPLPPIPRSGDYQLSSFPVGDVVSSQRLSEEGRSPRGNMA